jgi:DNA-binding transcriptional LysR family regulator
MKRSNINLLICLDALLSERSVTRAAQKLDMSQPGMSNALARLRELTGDPLLVRSGSGYLLTDRAHAIAAKVRSGLELMDEIFANEGPIDPAQATGTVTLAAVDAVGVALVPALARELAEQAPKVVLHLRAPDPERLREWLVEGECDVAIGHFPEVHPELRSTKLLTQELSCISAADAGPPPDTLEGYARRTHVVFGSPFAPRSTMETTLTRALAGAGVQRPSMVTASSMLVIPYVVAGSPHVATLPTWLCRHYAGLLPLQVSPLPFDAPKVDMLMVWHERTQRQALHAWIRELIRSIVPAFAAR